VRVSCRTFPFPPPGSTKSLTSLWYLLLPMQHVTWLFSFCKLSSLIYILPFFLFSIFADVSSGASFVSFLGSFPFQPTYPVQERSSFLPSRALEKRSSPLATPTPLCDRLASVFSRANEEVFLFFQGASFCERLLGYSPFFSLVVALSSSTSLYTLLCAKYRLLSFQDDTHGSTTISSFFPPTKPIHLVSPS